ncbi:MAG: type II toxin-antitoxin system prevent-host-death family antitoxin [Holosporaceae bacterium]|jgi:antitoxin YefM|nr:type II toxin-antitoxin system prevent-host-death family antitoxin [Holosporaceae bacterium]
MECSYTQLRQKLSAILSSVCDDYEEVYVTRKNGDRAVIVSAQEYESLKETAYLLSTENNRKDLVESMERANGGEVFPLEDLLK